MYLDLTIPKPQWTSSKATNMIYPRRQFNATILPDGSAFATGGSKAAGFNDYNNPAKDSELWNPTTKVWTKMAAESFWRCYHSVALLPDATVWSAGGGEYGGCGPPENHLEAQIFEPPYLFIKGGAPRPSIVTAPTEINYLDPVKKESFKVTISPTNTDIGKVTWIRLGSVTHCRNMSQSFISLQFTQSGTTLSILPPANANLSPPGHYMLFVLDKRGVPSIAKIIRISKPKEEKQRPLLGGAHDALRRLSDIEAVSPVPSQADSFAYVYLKRDVLLPDLDKWRGEFAGTVNASSEMRGIEVTLSGQVTPVKADGGQEKLVLSVGKDVQVRFAPFELKSQLRWDIQTRAAKAVAEEERGAYGNLLDAVKNGEVKDKEVQVTGTLQKQAGGGGFQVDVREFEVLGLAN